MNQRVMPPSAGRLCSNCKFYDPIQGIDGQGLCRRHAPQVNVVALPQQVKDLRAAQTVMQLVPHPFSSFPQVGGDGCWCGEFEQAARLLS